MMFIVLLRPLPSIVKSILKNKSLLFLSGLFLLPHHLVAKVQSTKAQVLTIQMLKENIVRRCLYEESLTIQVRKFVHLKDCSNISVLSPEETYVTTELLYHLPKDQKNRKQQIYHSKRFASIKCDGKTYQIPLGDLTHLSRKLLYEAPCQMHNLWK